MASGGPSASLECRQLGYGVQLGIGRSHQIVRAPQLHEQRAEGADHSDHLHTDGSNDRNVVGELARRAVH